MVSKPNAVPSSKSFRFDGGPRDGTFLVLANPPMRYVRLAFPQWCTYEFDDETGSFQYVGSEQVPKEHRGGW